MERLHRLKNLASAVAFLMLATLVFPLMAPPTFAQATSGGLRGQVTDQGGAVIPDADVTAKNIATGAENKTRSNADGLYSFPRLTPGIYNLDIQKQGFKRQEFQQVVINVGQDTTIDASLQAGQITETVTVTATGEELIQKEQAQISTTFETRKVAELPSNIAGGGIDTLALLAPGVVPGFGNVNGNGVTLSVNGQRSRSNNFTIDGQDNNDLSIGGPSFFVDNQDIVGEFQIITNNFSAEYGRNQGAIVNIVTKAGTNDYHGTLSWYHRDRKFFDSLTNIERRRGDKDPTPFLYNVLGGTFGGPIKKDRIFFFGSYQSILQRQTATLTGGPTIAPEELSRLKAAFPNNAAVQTLANFSAFALNDLGTLTERTDRPKTDFFVINGVNYRAAYPSRTVAFPEHQKEFSVRGDVRLTDKHSFWGRWLDQRAAGKNSLAGSNGFTGDVPFTGRHIGGALTSQISNSTVNEFRFSNSRLSVIFGGGCEGLKGCITHPDDILQTLANFNYAGINASRLVNGVVTNTGSANQLQTIGAATNLPQGRVVTSYQFVDNLSKTFGVHQLKMGVDIKRLTNSVPFLPNVNGAFRINSTARLAANAPSQVQLAVGQVEIAYNETDQYYYFEDNWRVADNLTLNLGVRYEYTGQPINTIHNINLARESDPATAIWKQSLPLDARVFPELPADKNNWAPRLGFAWRPRFGSNRFGKMLVGEQDATVVRGGYAIAYDPGFYNIMLNISTSSPVVFLNTTVNPATGTIPFPVPSANPTGEAVQGFATSNGLVVKNTFDPGFFNQTIVSPNFYSPYSQQWSLGIQRQINNTNVFEIRYVGNHAVGLFQTVNRNPRFDRLLNGFTLTVPGLGPTVFPGFPNLVPPGLIPQVSGAGQCVDNPATTTLNEAGTCAGRILPKALIRSRENTAQSTYNGLQIRYQGRLFNQLSIGASYSFSKTLDNASEIFSFSDISVTQNPFDFNRLEKGLSGNHRKHASSYNFLWDVPLFKQQQGVLGRVLGGWQVNGVYYLTSGRNFTPFQFCNLGCIGTGYDDVTFNSSFFGADALRPFTGNPKAPRGSVGISQIDAALIFGVPVTNANGFLSFNDLNKTGTVKAVTKDDVSLIFNGPGAARIFNNPFGDVGRGSLFGPILNNGNLGVFKHFKIRENVRLRFSLDIFNVFNHKNPGVGFNAGSSLPDQFTEDAGGADGFFDFGGMTGARRAFQFGLKLLF
jgi:outer membrane receptor protein involved in Fe transport